MNEYVKSDLFRYTGKSDFFTFAREYLINRAFRWQVAFRLWNSKMLPEKILGGSCGN